MNTKKVVFGLFLVLAIVSGEALGANWGRALEFDGNVDFALIGNFASGPTGNSPYTMEAWINISDWRYYYNGHDMYNGFIISRGAENPLSGNHLCLIDKHIGLTHWARDTNTGFAIELDRWYHVSATWDGLNESLYINGHQVWTQLFTTPLAVGGGTLTFGKHDNVQASYYICGQMDEVRMWDYARSEEQIQSTYLAPIDPNTAGLIGYWKFDEPDGQAIVDSTSYHNDGTLGQTSSPEDSDPRRVCSTLPLTGDFVSTYAVDLDDIISFASVWLTGSCLCPDDCTTADLNNDGLINLPDFAIFARHWLDSFTP